MRKDKIANFTIEVFRSAIHKLEFAIVIESGMVLEETEKERFISAYKDYHLSITPNVPVIMFQLETLTGVGSKLYCGGTEIYHLPPRLYPELEEMIQDAPFCVSTFYLEQVIRANYLNKSVFALLSQIHGESGLNVIGIKGYETTEA